MCANIYFLSFMGIVGGVVIVDATLGAHPDAIVVVGSRKYKYVPFLLAFWHAIAALRCAFPLTPYAALLNH